MDFWLASSEAFARNWFFLIYPLLITLQTALLGDIEYKNRTWKVIFTQPRNRGLNLAAKQFIALAVPFISTICMTMGIILSGIFLKIIKPEIHVIENIPIEKIGQIFLIPFLISWFCISIQIWVSLNWGNFVVSCSTGITFTLISIFLFEHEYSKYFPWDMPGLGLYKVLKNQPVHGILILNLALALIVLLLSNIHLSHKEITN